MGYVTPEPRKYKTQGKPTYPAAQLVLIGKRAVMDWDKLQEAGAYFLHEKDLYSDDEIKQVKQYFAPYWKLKHQEYCRNQYIIEPY